MAVPKTQRIVNRACRAFVVGSLLVVGLIGAAAADQRAYTFDDDPLRLGNKALEAGRLAEARVNFSEAVANDHHVPEALLGLAGIDLIQGHYDDAEAHYRQALTAAGGRQPEARAGLGLLLLRQGQDQAAASEFQTALQVDDENWTAHYGLARLALKAGDWETAREQLDHGREKRGRIEGEDRYQYGLALYLLGTGDGAGAERAAMHAQILNPADPQYPQLVARIHLEQGRVSLAISAYEQALAAPGMVAAAPLLRDLGQLYAQENRFNEARDRYLQAVSTDSTYAPAVKDLAELFHRARQYDRAAGTYLRYVDLVPDDGAAQLGLSECLGELKHFGEAAEAARSAMGQAPEDQVAMFQFARTGIHADEDSLKAAAADLMLRLPSDLPWQAVDLLDLAAWHTKLQDFDAAAAALARAATLAPDDPRVPFERGITELRAGRAATAVDHFQQAVALNPEAAAYHLNLGIAQYQAGRLEAAEPAFRQAVVLRPDLTTARLLLAQVLAARGSLTDAENEYRAVLVAEAKNPKAWRGVGFCRIRAADYAEAVAAYTQATNADPANVDGWAGLGSAQLGRGDLAAAEAAFAKARAIDPQNIMLKTGTELLNQAKKSGKEN